MAVDNETKDKTTHFDGLAFKTGLYVGESNSAVQVINSGGNIVGASLDATAASKVLISNTAANMVASTITTTTLGYLDATASIQTQLDAKAPTASPSFTGTVTAGSAASTVSHTVNGLLGVGDNIARASGSNSSIRLSGDTTGFVSSGGAVQVYGSSHTTKANDVEFAAGADVVGRYDDSADRWTLGADVDVNGNISVKKADVAAATTLAITTNGYVRITSGTPDIEGIVAGRTGQELKIANVTGNNLTIRHEATAATAVNRIHTPTAADVVSTGNANATLVYDDNAERWYLMSFLD